MKQGEVTIFIHVNKCIILSFFPAGVEGRGTGAGMTLFIHVDKYIILSFLPAGVEGRGTGPGEAGERRWG